MNTTQRIVFVVGATVIAAVFLFPPWVFVLDTPSVPGVARMQFPVAHRYEERPAGYHLVFGQHVPSDLTALNTMFETKETSLQFFRLRLDRNLLMAEAAGAILFFGLIAVATHRKQKV